MRTPASLGLSLAIAGASLLVPVHASADEAPIDVVASFSILADMTESVGGEHVKVTALVGPDSDAHVFSPSPSDARSLAGADLVVFNGLQFEGWIDRLLAASDYDGPLVVATRGIDAAGEGDGAHRPSHDHSDNHGHDHGHDGSDPHAWQDLAKGQIYVANIRDGLIAADPDNAAAYRDNAARYINELKTADAEIRELLSGIPANATVITGHDSFGHFSAAYGLRFLSPVGLSTEAQPSAANLAQLIDIIREQNVRALFNENMTNPSMLRQLSEETGLPIAGTLYADALASDGEASTYPGMLRHNARLIHEALATEDAQTHERSHDHEHEHHH